LLAVTANDDVPTAVGLPEIKPVEERASPAGRVPDVIPKVGTGTPLAES
jgi:hypothetical protein